MASPRKKDSQRFRIYTSQRSGFEFGFQPITERPNAYSREAGKPVQDLNIQVSPNEFDSPPPSTQPLGGKDISGSPRANSDFTNANASIQPISHVTYIFPAGIDINTGLMLHGDSTPIIDSSFSAKSVTMNGSVVFSTTQSKFGAGSISFTNVFLGTQSYLTLADSNDWNYASGNFTIDFWIYLTAYPSPAIGMLYLQSSDGTHNVTLTLASTGSLNFSVSNGTAIINFNTPNSSVLLNAWTHIAIVRNGANGICFINGISQSLSSLIDFGNQTIPDFTGQIFIGNDGSSTSGINGYLDEYRISKGVARWTSNFVVPSSAYQSNTVSIPISNANVPILISGSLSTVTMAANPQVSLGKQSQQITLECVGSSVTLLNGSGLTLNTSQGAQFTMTSGSLINLMYQTSNSTWFETSRSILFGDLGAL